MSISEFLYTVVLRPPLLRKWTNAFLRRILPERLAVGRAQICLNPGDPVVSGALTLGVYEREEITFFQQQFRPGMTFADVGANVGLYTGMALATPGFSGTILCVEPDEESRRFLSLTISANQDKTTKPAPRVHLCECAAWDKTDDLPFFRNPENRGDNRLYADTVLAQAGRIPARTLDDLCAERGISTIDFLKIDVQGAEGRVIAGARRILSASPSVILMTEFWPHGLTRCGSDPRDYLDSLCSLGFVLTDGLGRAVSPDHWGQLIEASSGRRYVNLFGRKGIQTS